MKTRTSRRDVLKQAAALTALAVTSPLLAADGPESPAKGFKIGGVDWELKGANNPEAFAVAARLGLDGVQVDLGNVEAMRNPDRQKQFMTLAQKHHVEIASLALGIFGGLPLATDKRAPAILDAAIDIATAMNQKIILVACFGKSDILQPAGKIDAFVGRLKEHAPKAEKAGVVLGLEGECSVEHYLKILDRIGSPAVKAYFDTAHAHVAGRDVVQEITLLKDRICEFHAKDCGSILLGEGKIDFAQVRRGMDAIGYRGWLQIEQWIEVSGKKPLGFDESHRRNLQYLRKLFPKQA
ncbi:MAG: sugar phosphate isomerase/epimerase family protein [Planctomycetota bacterium]